MSRATRPHPATSSVVDSLAVNRGVLVLSGYGLRLSVERGHLVALDGAGQDRRMGRFPRVASGIERVIVLGHTGTVTLEALRWLYEIGAAFVQIGADGELIAMGAPHALTDVHLRRNQASAMGTPEGLEIARWLLEAKVTAQAKVLDAFPGQQAARATVNAALEAITRAGSLDQLRFVESRAAAAYWNAWQDVPVHFVRADVKHVPAHWHTVGTRSSMLTTSPRKATSPANAVLNYLYAILESEARLAALAVGCDPSLGVIHTDKPSRDSLACDLMEPVRPLVDAYVLRLLQSQTFVRSDFFETRDGNCRLMPDVSRPLAATARQWAKALAPIAERVGGAFRHGAIRRGQRTGDASGSTTTMQRFRTPLTGANYSRSAKSRSVLPNVVTSLAARCRDCGAALGNRRTVYCDACRPKAAKRAAEKAMQTGRERRVLGIDGRSSDAAREKHRRHAVERAHEQQTWEASQDVVVSRAVYRRDIAPLLSRVPSGVLAAATGLSRQFYTKVKQGNATPHARHWHALRDAAAAYIAAHQTNIRILEDRAFFAREIAPQLRVLGAGGIQNATGLSASYSRRVLAGHHVPDRKHWPALHRALTKTPAKPRK